MRSCATVRKLIYTVFERGSGTEECIHEKHDGQKPMPSRTRKINHYFKKKGIL